MRAARGYTLFLTATEFVLALQRSSTGTKGTRSAQQAVVRMALVGASDDVQLEGLDVLPGKVSYFIGNDRRTWRNGMPMYARVRYANVYPGVDLVYYGNEGELEYDFVVAPGSDASAIRLAFDGADLEVDGAGDLVGRVASGEVRMRTPIVYQDVEGQRVSIDGAWNLVTAREARFRLGDYDTTRPLIIDPVLSYSTYLGGAADDGGADIAVDNQGHAYVTGYTVSADFPTTNGSVQPLSSGPGDAFVTKLDETGSTVVYSTYLGGSADDAGNGIAVDARGNAYVVGATQSADFPITGGLGQAFRGDTDVFVAKLDRHGSTLLYATYLGGSGRDDGTGIAVDPSGQAYVTGATSSSDFPTTPGAFQPFNAGLFDAFVAALDRRGSTLRYSTYLGSSRNDTAADIAVDASGHAYVTGSTRATDFPTTPGALRPASNGLSDEAFVTKLNRSGSSLDYSTYLGGTGNDFGAGVAVDAQGHAYVTGGTGSADFPTTTGAFQRSGQGDDAFVTKLNRTGTALQYSTYLGGTHQEWGNDIAVDNQGHAYVTGSTQSSDFPTKDSFQDGYGGNVDAFVSRLDRAGATLVYSSYLGGSDREDGVALALRVSGAVYVTGLTSSGDFPTTVGAFQTSFGGDRDAFIVKIAESRRGGAGRR